MKITHNKKNDWETELRMLGYEDIIEFVKAVVLEVSYKHISTTPFGNDCNGNEKQKLLMFAEAVRQNIINDLDINSYD